MSALLQRAISFASICLFLAGLSVVPLQKTPILSIVTNCNFTSQNTKARAMHEMSNLAWHIRRQPISGSLQVVLDKSKQYVIQCIINRNINYTNVLLEQKTIIFALNWYLQVVRELCRYFAQVSTAMVHLQRWVVRFKVYLYHQIQIQFWSKFRLQAEWPHCNMHNFSLQGFRFRSIANCIAQEWDWNLDRNLYLSM